MPVVLIYRNHLLARSETFIKRQVKALSRWDGVLIGQPMTDGLALDDVAHRAVKIPRATAASKLLQKLQRCCSPQPALNELSSFQRARSIAQMVRMADWFKVLRAMNPRLLQVHFGTDAEEAWPIAIALNIPMVVTLHGFDASIYDVCWESGRQGKKYRQYPSAIRAMSDRGTKFIAVSDAIKHDALKLGINPLSIRKIIIGVAIPESYRSAMEAREPRVLFVGRIVEKKGLEFLLRAFSTVKAAVPSAELRVIGDGPLGGQLREFVAAQGLQVKFLGWQSEETVMAEMHEARVLCVPSVRAANGNGEGLPTVIMEAQAIGLPVVTSARGGTTEGIIDGVTGIAVKEAETSELATALIRVLTDDVFAKSASVQARAFAEERLNIVRQTRALEEFYDEIIEVVAADGSKHVWF
jgi:glycosyltransferase involved in cell wall biosynthesis